MKKLVVILLIHLACTCMYGQTPGGIGTTKMSIWYSGDHGVSDDGTLTWLDRSGVSSNALQPTEAEKATQINLFNFNQTFTFDGTSDRFAIENLSYTSSQVLTDLSAFVVYATAFSNASYNSNWAFIDFDRSEAFNFYIHGNGQLAMSYESEGTQDLVASTASNNGLPHMATYLFDSGDTNESIMKLDGSEDYSGDNTASDITVSADRFGFIGDGSEANAFNGSKNNIYYQGDIAEVIFYDKGDLDASDIKKIESYLAIKYGITLDAGNASYVNSVGVAGTVLWDNLGYWNDVAGLVQDNAGALDQRVSKSAAYDRFIVAKDNDYVSANNAGSRTSIGDGKSLMYGHNNVADGFTSYALGEYLFSKTWLFQEKNGDVGNVYIAIDKSLFTGESVDLIISSDAVFESGDTRVDMIEGTTHYYVEVNITDNQYVSFVMTQSSTGPGGVLSGLEIWFKSDNGVSSTGSAVTDVFDHTYNGYNLSQDAAANQPSNNAATNFNTNITFDGSSDRMPIEAKNFTSAESLSQVYVWTVYNTDFTGVIASGSLDTSNWAFLDFDRSEWFNASIHGDGTLQFAYNSGGIKDNYGVEVTNDGTAKLGGFIFDLNDSEETKIRVNGNEDLSLDRTNVAINSSLTRFGYVGDGSEATSFNSSDNDGYYDGSISEVIYYENQIMSAIEINKIEFYLAIKYGITLNTSSVQYLASTGTTIWDDVTYWNDIGIIGRDANSGLDQKQSKSTNTDAIVTVALGNTIETLNPQNLNEFGADLNFLAWGNNDADAVISEIVFPTLLDEISPCNYSYMGLDRDWKVKKTGGITGVTLQFDMSGFANPGDFDLIINETGDTDYELGELRFLDEGVLSGTNLIFSNITINDGEVFTLIRKNPDAEVRYVSSTWSGGNNAGVLDASGSDLLKSVQLLENVTLPAEANCKCLEVASGVLVTVEDGKNLLVSDVLKLDGDIYLYGDAQLVQTLDGEDLNLGGGFVYKAISEGTSSVYRFNYWGSPVRNGNTYDLATNLFVASDPNDFTTISSPAYTSGYDGSTGVISSYWLYDFNNSQSWSAINETSDKPLGSGFTMKGMGEATNIVFGGKPNNGSIKLDLDKDNYFWLGIHIHRR